MKFLRHSFSRWLCLFIAAFQLAAVAAELSGARSRGVS